MKKLLLPILLVLSTIPGFSKNDANSNPDAIVGEYLVPDKKAGDSKVKFFKAPDGTYSCQVFWLEKPVDPETGKPWLDKKNPNRSLRSRRADSIVLVEGLKYNAGEKQWDGAKIYDPNRGIKANVTCKFADDGKLTVRGSVLGIGETQVWPKL